MPGPLLDHYTRLHHAYWLNPGIDGLSPRAETTWTRALAYSDQHLTDGRVSRAGLKMIDRTPRDAAALVSAGLWSETGDGWQINDYSEWGTTAEKIRKKRRGNAERQARHRARNALREPANQTDTEQIPLDLRHDTDRITSERQQDHQAETGIPPGHSAAGGKRNALRNAFKHNTDTTQNIGGVDSNRSGPSITTETNDGADAPGRDRTPATPGRCEAHAHIPPGDYVPACHACRDARLELDHDQATTATARRAELDACPWCDANGWRLIDGPAVRCDHTPPSTTTTTPPAAATSAPGSSSSGRRARVSDDTRAAIRRDVAAGRGTTREIAARYGVAQSTVSRLSSDPPARVSRAPAA